MTIRNTATKANKAELVKKFGKAASDTGSAEAQVALITHRINALNAHHNLFKKDHSANLGLVKLVGQRRRLLTYLRDTDAQRYTKLIQALELRK
jgi:small subunit ribosomal protein S15